MTASNHYDVHLMFEMNIKPKQTATEGECCWACFAYIKRMLKGTPDGNTGDWRGGGGELLSHHSSCIHV